MKYILRKISFLLCILLSVTGANAQLNDVQLRSPFDFELLLSANFGELRSNHFHAGVDFKTGEVSGKQIKCIADGYICRAKVETAGYGLALYVMHDGYMTVYGHLDRFPANVAKRVRDYQYDKERFEVDMHFGPDEFPVKRGELLAHAGNTGYSFGPHLHFEVRDTTGNELYNPLAFYKDKIKDTRAPKATALAVYPRRGGGALFAGDSSRVFKLKNGVLCDTIEAWGDIAFAVEALDYMDKTSNKYGIYHTMLFVDGEMCYEAQMDNFSFDENKLVLTSVDKGREKRGEATLQKLFIAPNNPFRGFKADGRRGWVTIDEERIYNVECHLLDFHGNKSVVKAVVRGDSCAIAQSASEGLLSWRRGNTIEAPGASLVIPQGELFDDALFSVVNDSGVCTVSGVYASTGEDVFFRRGATLSLSADDVMVEDKSKLYICEFTEKDTTWVGGKYADGRVVGSISSQGCYGIAADTLPPVLKPVNEKAWMNNARLVFDLYDNETRVTSFRGTLNGKFVLFKYNRKERRLTFDFRQENIRSGNLKLKVVVTDAYGNSTEFEKSIKY